MKRLTIISILTVCLPAPVSWEALASQTQDSVAASQSFVMLEFVDDHGLAFEAFAAPSDRPDVYRAYLEARPRARYAIRARNLSAERVGIVIAVDGRNIISGQRSELKANESMYVLGPYESATYSGWRTSASAVRRFYFTSVEDSYASRIGDESAMGVIAAAVFRGRDERRRAARRQSAEPAPSAAVADSGEKRAGRSRRAGTGFGEQQHSHAIRVTFSPRRYPSQRSFFKYEWREQLCARGVTSCEPGNRFWPEPWQGFVPLPPGERG